MVAVSDERIVVPWELDRAARNRLRRFPCLLCGASLAGSRAVASTTEPTALEGDLIIRPLWVAHHGCYLAAFRFALRSFPEMRLAPSEDHAHQLFRSVLDKRANPTT